MKFGPFYELQVPRPWDHESEHRLVQNSLDQVELCDRLGFDCVWATEHHFLEEYAHNSAPEVFLAACSQRTKNIRIGHGIVQLPPAVNHPARVAERIAMLDLVSNGRVEFGTGAGASEAELAGFLVTQEEKKAMWAEALEAIVRMFVEDPFRGYEGKYFKMPPRNVVPKTYQKPHPPMWQACSRNDSILQAARLGLGAMTLSFPVPEEVRPWVKNYRDALENECAPVGSRVTTQFGVSLPFLCVRDEKQIEQVAAEGFKFFVHALGHYAIFGHHVPGTTNIWQNFQAKAREALVPKGWQSSCVGTPEMLRKRLRDFEDAGVDQIICLSQAGNISHETLCESFELFAKEVMPEFKEREAKRARERAESDARIWEKGLARKPKVAVPDAAPAPIPAAGHR
ncbi:MAG TPA: LLM class flavin-dependent oxidoreductase [Candidatus Acidoferrales bacterium]|nr:LLM class flavin-dependent oxidoreductase [Candidatus Acidoferrales bacterium]